MFRNIITDINPLIRKNRLNLTLNLLKVKIFFHEYKQLKINKFIQTLNQCEYQHILCRIN
jgi:hypothetical protein